MQEIKSREQTLKTKQYVLFPCFVILIGQAKCFCFIGSVFKSQLIDVAIVHFYLFEFISKVRITPFTKQLKVFLHSFLKLFSVHLLDCLIQTVLTHQFVSIAFQLHHTSSYPLKAWSFSFSQGGLLKVLIWFCTRFMFFLSFLPSLLSVFLSIFLMTKTLWLRNLAYSCPKLLRIHETELFKHFLSQSVLFLKQLSCCFKVLKSLKFANLQTFVMLIWLLKHFPPFHTSFDIHQEVSKSQQLSSQAKKMQISEYLFKAIAMNIWLFLPKSSVTRNHHFLLASFSPSLEFSSLKFASFE